MKLRMGIALTVLAVFAGIPIALWLFHDAPNWYLLIAVAGTVGAEMVSGE